MSRLEIIQGDITTLKVDAIVNAANPSLMGGGGVDGAIHKAAGPELKNACRPLRGCHTGHAKTTKGFNLPSNYVIHAVGPVWNNGTNQEESLLVSAYRSSLEEAVKHEVKTIAFPCISTGAYRFPFYLAGKIALKEIISFLAENNTIEKVTLVTFSEKDLNGLLKIYNNEFKT